MVPGSQNFKVPKLGRHFLLPALQAGNGRNMFGLVETPKDSFQYPWRIRMYGRLMLTWLGYIDGKCDTINMAYIRIRHGIEIQRWDSENQTLWMQQWAMFLSWGNLPRSRNLGIQDKRWWLRTCEKDYRAVLFRSRFSWFMFQVFWFGGYVTHEKQRKVWQRVILFCLAKKFQAIYILVGGLEHFFPHILGIIIPID